MKVWRLVVAIVGVLLMLGFNLSPADATTYPTTPNTYYYGDHYCDSGATPPLDNHLWDSCYIAPGWRIWSSNGRDRLAFGTNGDLAGLVNSTGDVWWHTGTETNPDPHYRGSAIWASDSCNLSMDGATYPDGSGHGLWQAGLPSINPATGKMAIYYGCRITMGGDGHWSLWSQLTADSPWVRVKSYPAA